MTPDDIDDLDKCCKMAERESRAALALARSMRITHQSTTPSRDGSDAATERYSDLAAVVGC